MLIVTAVTLFVFYRRPDNFDIRSAFTCACIRIGAYKYFNMNEIEQACSGIMSQKLATPSKADEGMGLNPSLRGKVARLRSPCSPRVRADKMPL